MLVPEQTHDPFTWVVKPGIVRRLGGLLTKQKLLVVDGGGTSTQTSNKPIQAGVAVYDGGKYQAGYSLGTGVPQAVYCSVTRSTSGALHRKDFLGTPRRTSP